ncbi:MAG: carboxymuconolactone decarboxylase family protein [Alphaproteobacteria bacterium]|nr:carboxymuconolactone decarboxylase family protein [Alphaproteobacteria bacterium]
MGDEATQRGIDNLMKTFGRVPDTFRVMLEHAPAAFAGYTTMRAFVMRDRDEGAALDLKTKELVFVLLDVQMGNVTGAKSHATNALRLGLTVPELVEGLVQVIMAAGITSWNLAGREVLEHALAIAAAEPS